MLLNLNNHHPYHISFYHASPKTKVWICAVHVWLGHLQSSLSRAPSAGWSSINFSRGTLAYLLLLQSTLSFWSSTSLWSQAPNPSSHQIYRYSQIVIGVLHSAARCSAVALSCKDLSCRWPCQILVCRVLTGFPGPPSRSCLIEL